MTFREFVLEQMARLRAFAEFDAKVPADGQKEIRKWMEDRAKCDPKAVSASVMSWIQNDEAARRVKTVIDECLTFESLPDLRTMRAVWDRLFPPENVLRKSCGRCGGAGWVVVDGEYGASAAYPCSHGPETAAEARMGVRFAPATAKQYAIEETASSERQEEWLRSRAEKHQKGFQKITQADVDAILYERKEPEAAAAGRQG